MSFVHGLINHHDHRLPDPGSHATMTHDVIRFRRLPASNPPLRGEKRHEEKINWEAVRSPQAEPARLWLPPARAQPAVVHGHNTVRPGAVFTHEDAASPVAGVKKHRVRAKTERRRQQCRRNQARYRTKQNLHAMELESSVAQLQQQILQLEAQRRALTWRINNNNPTMRVAMEHCRLFSRGLAIDDHQPRRRSFLPTLDEQTRFVTANFHRDARIAGSYGRDHVLRHAWAFTSFYGGLHLTPQGYTIVSTPSPDAAVKASLLLEVTFNESTIRNVYPHLLDQQLHSITRTLLGLRLQCSASVDFVFDEHGDVASVDWTIDFVSAFQRVLTTEQIVVVLQQERIVRDSYLLVTDDPWMPVTHTFDQDQGKEDIF